MRDVVLGLVGVGRIGVMHANNIAALNGVLNPEGHQRQAQAHGRGRRPRPVRRGRARR